VPLLQSQLRLMFPQLQSAIGEWLVEWPRPLLPPIC
jgi:hypothetical protein